MESKHQIGSLKPIRFSKNYILYVNSELESNSIKRFDIITKQSKSIFTILQGQALQWALIDDILHVLDNNFNLTKLSLDGDGKKKSSSMRSLLHIKGLV